MRLPRFADRCEIIAGHHRNHALRGSGGRGIDRADAGVRIGAAQECDVREFGDVNVIGVPASAGGEPDGFGARHAAPDDGLAVGHVPRSGGSWATASIASTMA